MIVHAGYNFDKMRPLAVVTPLGYGGNSVANATVLISEDDSVLSFMHESLHAIGGRLGPYLGSPLRVPDLYDESLAEANRSDVIYMGNWDIMSSEAVGPSAWTKLKLGWIPQENILMITNWNNTILTLSRLESPTNGTIVVEIPISESNITIVGGVNVTASSYYLIEYRVPIGIDRNLSSSGVLITRASDANYLESLPDPVSAVSNPSNVTDTRHTFYFSDTSLNLAIIVLKETPENATILVTQMSRVSTFTDASNTIARSQSMLTISKNDAGSWFYSGPSVSALQGDIQQAQNLLTRGNAQGAEQIANQAISSVNESQTNTIQIQNEIVFLFDFVATIMFVLSIALTKKRARDGSERLFGFSKWALLIVFLVGSIVVFGTTYEESLGLSETVYGIQQGVSSSIQDGQTSLILGIAVWIAGLLALFSVIRNSIINVEVEAA